MWYIFGFLCLWYIPSFIALFKWRKRCADMIVFNTAIFGLPFLWFTALGAALEL